MPSLVLSAAIAAGAAAAGFALGRRRGPRPQGAAASGAPSDTADPQWPLRWEKQALEFIMQPGPLPEVLDRIMLGLEAQVPGALCSVLLIDESGRHLRRCAGPSLPTAYADAIDGVTIGPCVGSCGTAAHDDRVVIVSDIRTDPLWADFRDLAAQYGLRACWSTPIHSVTGAVLGTFAVYYREPRLPRPSELDLVERAEKIVALAIIRKQGEAALQEHRERLELALQGGNLGVWQWFPASGKTTHSATWAQMLEYPPEDIEGDIEFFTRHVHPDDLPDVRRRLEAHLHGDTPVYESQHRLRTSSGGWKWVIDRGCVVRSDASGPTLVTGVVSDITALKESEEAVRASRRVLEAILDAIPVRVFWKDQDLRIAGCNTAYARDAGFSTPDEIIGRDDYAMAWHEQADLYRADDLAVIRSGKPRLFIEEPQSTPDGGLITLLTSKVPLRNSAGEVTGILGTYLDISKRKQAEEEVRRLNADLEATVQARTEELRASEENYRLMIQSEESVKRLAAFPEVNPNPVLELTADGALTYSNNAASALAKTLGLDEPAAMLPSDAAAIVSGCVAQGKERRGLEYRIGKRTLSWAFYPIAGRGVVHAYAADITDRLTLEAQLRQAQKLEAIGQLAGGVAHDFNNILSVVMMQADVSAADESLSDETRESLHEIRACAERGADLTRQLLLFSRRQVMQPRDLDLNEVVTALAKMLQRLIGEDVRLELQLHSTALPTHADAGMLNQVLLNLAVNARDAMPDGGRLRVETWERVVGAGDLHPDVAPGRYVGMGVSDTGCGIAPDVLPRIFEPFFTTKEAGRGTGLGLATAFGIVRQHGGWVDVASEIGRGTTFDIYLPATAVTAAAAEPSRPAASGGSETLLVVEDETAVRALVRTILVRRGYKVIEASSGVEALRIWDTRRDEVALLLTDLVMPDGISGQELARRLRADVPALRVIFSSGYSPEFAGRELKLGAGETFLQKPFAMDVLLETVRRSLDGRLATA